MGCLHKRYDLKIVMGLSLGFLCLPLVAVETSAAPQELPAATVLDVSGGAEVLHPSVRRWVRLEKMTPIPSGSKVRTGDKGSTQIIFEKNLETVVKLDKNSQLSFPTGRPQTVFLEKGRLFVLREEGAAGAFEIRTRHLRMHLGLGGCILDASAKGLRVRMFGGEALLDSQGAPLAEGYQFLGHFAGKKAEKRKTRMVYHDTIDWEAWVRRWYEVKDDFFADKLEKEMDF